MPDAHPLPILDYSSGGPAPLDRTVNKVMARLIPFVVLLYLLNYLDRTNISFAGLQMTDRLGFTKQIYGLGAGIFFIGYFLFEVPSNLIMERVGARLWMARIMISWGIISTAMMLVHGKWSFYTLRFLLGVAEAGFAPGVLLYLTYWVPQRQQGRAVAWFLTSTALSGVLGMPLAGLLIRLDGAHLGPWTLQGWQWLFLAEGLPSVLLGIVVLFVLTDRPEQARWLTHDERQVLGDHLAAERQARDARGHSSLLAGLASGRVWVLNIIYCMIMFGFQGFNYWIPRIVKAVTGLGDGQTVQIGLLSAIPYAAAVVAMVLVGRHSDRTGERRWHVAIPAATGAAALLACAITHSPLLAVAMLTLAAAGIWSTLGPFWALPPQFLSGTAAAAGIAMVNSVGNLGGGYLGPWLTGLLWDRTHSYRAGLYMDSAVLAAAAVVTLLAVRRSQPSSR